MENASQMVDDQLNEAFAAMHQGINKTLQKQREEYVKIVSAFISSKSAELSQIADELMYKAEQDCYRDSIITKLKQAIYKLEMEGQKVLKHLFIQRQTVADLAEQCEDLRRDRQLLYTKLKESIRDQQSLASELKQIKSQPVQVENEQTCMLTEVKVVNKFDTMLQQLNLPPNQHQQISQYVDKLNEFYLDQISKLKVRYKRQVQQAQSKTNQQAVMVDHNNTLLQIWQDSIKATKKYILVRKGNDSKGGGFTTGDKINVLEMFFQNQTVQEQLTRMIFPKGDEFAWKVKNASVMAKLSYSASKLPHLDFNRHNSEIMTIPTAGTYRNMYERYDPTTSQISSPYDYYSQTRKPSTLSFEQKILQRNMSQVKIKTKRAFEIKSERTALRHLF